MREIKFRAWDKDEQVMGEVTRLDEMVYVEYLSSKPVTSCLHCAGLKCSHPHKYISNTIELMQYTGLKDRYGKEIYEGDIVTSLYPKDTYKTAGVVKDLDYSWVVQYPDDQYVGGHDDIDLAAIAFMCPVIIGNIYENPELLESE